MHANAKVWKISLLETSNVATHNRSSCFNLKLILNNFMGGSSHISHLNGGGSPKGLIFLAVAVRVVRRCLPSFVLSTAMPANLPSISIYVLPCVATAKRRTFTSCIVALCTLANCSFSLSLSLCACKIRLMVPWWYCSTKIEKTSGLNH